MIITPSDVLPRYQSMSTWKQNVRKHASKGSSETGARRQQKRSRLGNSTDRAIYKNAKGHRHSKWPALCARADSLNGR